MEYLDFDKNVPPKYGFYEVVLHDGTMDVEIWNGSGWATLNKKVAKWRINYNIQQAHQVFLEMWDINSDEVGPAMSEKQFLRAVYKLIED